MSDWGMATDEAIAQRVQEGDIEAFGVLMERYEEKLLRYAVRLLRDSDKGDEVVQETFIQAYRNIHSFNPLRRFSPWIYRIAHNQAINEIRRVERSPLHLDLDTFALFPAKESAATEAEHNEMRRIIDLHLNQLRPEYREVLVLFYFEELDYHAIADVLHIPTSTVGVRLKRARVALKKAMAHAYE